MKRVKLFASIVLCSFVFMIGSVLAATYMSDGAVWNAAKEKYADFNLKSIKWLGSTWKMKKTISRNGDDLEVNYEAERKCKVTDANGVVRTGFMILSGGPGNWDFDRFFVSETEATKVKKLSGAELRNAVVGAYKNSNPNIMCSLLDTLPSNLFCIKIIDISNVKTPSENYMTGDVKLSTWTRDGYTSISQSERVVEAEFRKTDGVWNLVVSRNKSFGARKDTPVAKQQADSFKTLESAGWDGIYGLAEPQP